MTHPNSVHNLVEHIKSISSSRNKSSPDKLSQTQLKLLMSQDYKNPWKNSGVVRKGNEIDRLPIGDLDNWEILRVNMSKRSYNYPKKFKGLKISGVGRQFSRITDKDKDGKIPYLYKSDVQKIDNIRKKIYTKNFRTANAARNDVFGFPKDIHQKGKRPHSFQTLEKINHHPYH